MPTTLKEYLKKLKPQEKKEFAKKVPTSLGYLNIVAGGFRRPGPLMSIQIEQASGGQVHRGTLRPDLWPLSSGGPRESAN